MIGIGMTSIRPSTEVKANATNSVKQGEGSGFGSVFSSIMGSTQQIAKEQNTGTNSLLAKEDIQTLIDFLQNQDVQALANGDELLQDLMLDENMNFETIVQDILNISNQDLSQLMKSLETMLSDLGMSSQTLKQDGKIEDLLDEVMSLLVVIQTLPIEQFQKVVNQDFESVMKYTKLVELLSNNQDMGSKQQELTKLIETVTQKLEQLQNSASKMDRMVFLQKTFTLLSNEINQSTNKDNAKSSSQVDSKIKILQAGIVDSQAKGYSVDLNEKYYLQPLSKPEMVKVTLDSSGKIVELQEPVPINLQNQLNKPEQLTLLLEGSRRPVSADQLIKQFESILAKSQFSKMNGTQRLLIKLAPEHLGSLRIELIQKDQMLVAKILTTTGAAKETLETQLNGLKQAMVNQNIQVEKIEISQQMTAEDRPQQRNQRDSEQQGKQQDQNHNEKQQHSHDINNESFRDIINQLT